MTVYIEVDDVQAHLDKAVTLGGKAILPVIPIPQGQFSWFSDPDGNIIGLMKTAKAATGV